MDLTDLQVELRSIEQRIAALHLEIEKMKPKTPEEKRADFDAITKLARKYPLTNSVISSVSEPVRKQLIGGLTSLLQPYEKDCYEGLLYLSRLSWGCGMEFSAEEIYRAGLEFSLEGIERACAVLQKYKYTYLVEAFVIAGLVEEKWNEKLVVIADVAALMGCDQEEVQVTAQVAKCRLTGNWELLKVLSAPSKSRWLGKFAEYIPQEWIIKQRIFCGSICNKKWTGSGGTYYSFLGGKTESQEMRSCLIKKRVQAGSIVKRGEVILEYEEADKTTAVYTAPCNGVAFFINENRKGKVQDKPDQYLTVYVVSYFDVYGDFCKWHTAIAK